MAVLAVVALAVGGWWYVRNALLYGDPLGLSVHLNTPWARPAQISLTEVLPSLPLVYRSFWGRSAGATSKCRPSSTMSLRLCLSLSLVGWLAPTCRRAAILVQPATASHSAILLMCGLWCGAIFVSFVRWNQQVEAPHGRLLFPDAWRVCACCSSLGWRDCPGLAWCWASSSLGFLLLSLAVPFAYIRPAYAWPELFPPDQLAVVRPSGCRVATFAVWRRSAADRLGAGSSLGRAGRVAQRDAVLDGGAAHDAQLYTCSFTCSGARTSSSARGTPGPGWDAFPRRCGRWVARFATRRPSASRHGLPVPELYGVEVGLYDAKTNERLEAADAAGQSIAAADCGPRANCAHAAAACLASTCGAGRFWRCAC